MAQFDDPDSLVSACDRARQAGYVKMDAHSPFPIHGIDPAIGIRRTRLPFFVLALAFCACGFGLWLQYYTNAVDTSSLFPGYRFFISGKPNWSLPANIPVGFEIIVLTSAFAAFFGMWALNRLPRFANPLHRVSRFRRATNDRFFLVIEQADEKFDLSRTQQQLEEWGATAIERVEEDLTDHDMPRNLKLAGVVLVMLLFVPPSLIFKESGATSRHPRLHVVPDMDWQHKYKAQVLGPNVGDPKNPVYFFSDLRAARPPIAGTVARGKLELDIEFFKGYREVPAAHHDDHQTTHASRSAVGSSSIQDGDTVAQDKTESTTPPEPDWIAAFPSALTVDEALLNRGRERFDIYCSVCHGYDGNGNGLVNQRGMALNAQLKAKWTAAKSLHDPAVKVQPVGRIFDTITNGRNTMGPYGSQIPVQDRWAIVAYVRALQLTGIEPETAAAPAEAGGSGAGETGPMN
ncbi:MAG TPA: DUF3341 domain-containing protein [Pirellulaceae bacterium]|nr:DUF3341 domain-containing protein [Pirellulaceae bacterium]